MRFGLPDLVTVIWFNCRNVRTSLQSQRCARQGTGGFKKSETGK